MPANWISIPTRVKTKSPATSTSFIPHGRFARAMVLSGMVWASALVPGVAHAVQGQIIGSPDAFYPPSGYRPKDFSIVKDDYGIYHIFYIKHSTTDNTELALGHATSSNLNDWFDQGIVLPVEPGQWDDVGVWAPSIARDPATLTYYMYFTGVHNEGGQQIQRIGVATSSDLYNWSNRQLVLDCQTAVPWSQCGSFRDPFVMPDPANPGQWLMYYATRTKLPSDLSQFPFAPFVPGFVPDTTVLNGDYAIGIARATSDLLHWTDVYPIWVTYAGYTYNTLLESPHLFSHNELWYLMTTTNAGKPLSFSTGPDPAAQTYQSGVGSPAWTYRGRLADMFPHAVPTALPDPTPGALPPYVGSEYFRDSNSDEYFGMYTGESVIIYQIRWHPSPEFEFDLLEPVHVTGIGFANNSVGSGEAATMTISTLHDYSGRVANLEWYDITVGAPTRIANPQSLGLPTSATLGATGATRTFNPYDSHPEIGYSNYVCRYLAQSMTLHVYESGGGGGGPYEFPANAKPGTEPTPRSLSLSAIGGRTIELTVGLPHDTRTRLDVYDISGRHVARLMDGWQIAGSSAATWDGRRDDGGNAGPGVYFARLITIDGSKVARFALTH